MKKFLTRLTSATMASLCVLGSATLCCPNASAKGASRKLKLKIDESIIQSLEVTIFEKSCVNVLNSQQIIDFKPSFEKEMENLASISVYAYKQGLLNDNHKKPSIALLCGNSGMGKHTVCRCLDEGFFEESMNVDPDGNGVTVYEEAAIKTLLMKILVYQFVKNDVQYNMFAINKENNIFRGSYRTAISHFLAIMVLTGIVKNCKDIYNFALLMKDIGLEDEWHLLDDLNELHSYANETDKSKIKSWILSKAKEYDGNLQGTVARFLDEILK